MGKIYSSLKILQHPDKIASLPPEVDRVLPPLHVRVKPTNVCNHSCWYCAYRTDDLQLGKDMVVKDRIPWPKMEELLEDFTELGVRAITFSGGGEPFYYEHFEATLRKLVDTPIAFGSLTNGTHVDGLAAELFALHGTWLRISIDGWDEASYQRYRNLKKPGSYQRVLDNMVAFKRHGGKCRLGISLIIDEQNADRVFESVQRYKDCGADSVKLSPVIVSNDGAANNDYHRRIWDTARAQIDRCKAELASGTFEVYDAYHELDTKFDKDYDWCPYQQIVPVVGADLRVYTCQDKAYNLDSGLLGSIAEQRFRDFWLGDKAKFFRVNPSRDCNHHCVAAGKNTLVHELLGLDQEHGAFV